MHRLRYIEMNDLSFRNIWYGVAAAMVIAIVGALLFYDDGQAAMSVVAVLGMVVAIAVLHILDRRELRQRGDDKVR